MVQPSDFFFLVDADDENDGDDIKDVNAAS